MTTILSCCKLINEIQAKITQLIKIQFWSTNELIDYILLCNADLYELFQPLPELWQKYKCEKKGKGNFVDAPISINYDEINKEKYKIITQLENLLTWIDNHVEVRIK